MSALPGLQKFWKDEQGVTLIELTIVIILIGVALPSILSMMGLVTVHSARNGIMEEAVALAESKMEQIIGKKEALWSWYKSSGQFETTESLDDGFQRSVTVTHLSDWGDSGLEGWEVEVAVTHPLLPNGYRLVVRLTKYH